MPNPAIRILASLVPCTLPVAALGAVADAGGDNWVWNLIIAVLVLVFTLASALLPLAALRQWSGPWRYIAAAPLLLLFLWAALIGSQKLINPALHPLWSLQMFAWAMLNMIYMVAAMTAKRVFIRADEQGRSDRYN